MASSLTVYPRKGGQLRAEKATECKSALILTHVRVREGRKEDACLHVQEGKRDGALQDISDMRRARRYTFDRGCEDGGGPERPRT